MPRKLTDGHVLRKGNVTLFLDQFCGLKSVVEVLLALNEQLVHPLAIVDSFVGKFSENLFARRTSPRVFGCFIHGMLTRLLHL